MGFARELARGAVKGVEEGLRTRYADAPPTKRGVAKGVYEGVTGRKLKLPKRREPLSMRGSDGEPRSFRSNGRPRKLMRTGDVQRRIARQLAQRGRS